MEDQIVQKIRQNEVQYLKEYFGKYPNKVNEANQYGKTYLMYACEYGKTDIITLLIDAGAEMEKIDKQDGWTALHFAVWNRRLDAATILISRGADLNVKDNDGDTPLHLAVIGGCLGQEWEDGVAAFLTPGKQILKINEQNKAGNTPLHLACYNGFTRTVRLLMNRSDIDANLVNRDGDTPLHLAVQDKRYDVVTLMLSQDQLELNIKDRKGMTPLLEAVSVGHLGMMHKLIARGANINAVDNQGNNCLHLAVKIAVFHSEEEDLGILDKYAFKLSLSKKDRLSSPVVASYLYHFGANFYHKNNENVSPLDLIKDTILKDKLKTFLPPPCMFCEDTIASKTFHTCGHTVLCEECYIKIACETCPTCQQPITESSKFVEDVLKTSQQVETQLPRKQHLEKVANTLGNDWWLVGILLEIESTDLENIQLDNRNNAVQRSYQMLLEWFLTCDAKKCTLDTLREVLEEAECLVALRYLSSVVK